MVGNTHKVEIKVDVYDHSVRDAPDNRDRARPARGTAVPSALQRQKAANLGGGGIEAVEDPVGLRGHYPVSRNISHRYWVHPEEGKATELGRKRILEHDREGNVIGERYEHKPRGLGGGPADIMDPGKVREVTLLQRRGGQVRVIRAPRRKVKDVVDYTLGQEKKASIHDPTGPGREGQKGLLGARYGHGDEELNVPGKSISDFAVPPALMGGMVPGYSYEDAQLERFVRRVKGQHKMDKKAISLMRAHEREGRLSLSAMEKYQRMEALAEREGTWRADWVPASASLTGLPDAPTMKRERPAADGGAVPGAVQGRADYKKFLKERYADLALRKQQIKTAAKLNAEEAAAAEEAYRKTFVGKLNTVADKAAAGVGWFTKDFGQGKIDEIGKGMDRITYMMRAGSSFAMRSVRFMGPAGLASLMWFSQNNAMIPAVAQFVLRTLSIKGAPLNRDWRQAIGEVSRDEMTVERQRARDMGDDPLILAYTNGFQPPDSYYSSQERVDRIRLQLGARNHDMVGTREVIVTPGGA